jgi:hypothetical protein
MFTYVLTRLVIKMQKYLMENDVINSIVIPNNSAMKGKCRDSGKDQGCKVVPKGKVKATRLCKNIRLW